MKTEKETRVEIFVPKGYLNEEPNFFVGVNGVSYLLPRGRKSLVPPQVAAEYNRALRAQEALEARKNTLLGTE